MHPITEYFWKARLFVKNVRSVSMISNEYTSIDEDGHWWWKLNLQQSLLHMQQTKVTYTRVKNAVFVTHSTLGYPRAVLSLEQGLTFLLPLHFIVMLVWMVERHYFCL